MFFFDIWRQKREKHNCNTNIKYGPDVTASQILRPLLAKPRENQKPKNLEKTKKNKKPKNQNFSENVWSEAHVCFFLVFLEFFCFFFGHDLEKIKKTQGFFGFLKELLIEVRQKTKKTQVFFWFLDRFLEDI